MSETKHYFKNMLVLEKDRLKNIEIDDEKFTIRYPFPLDRKNMARQEAIEYNGHPIASFSSVDRYMFEREAYIDNILEEKPGWWGDSAGTGLKTEDILNTLYKEGKDWEKEFDEKLKKNKFPHRNKVA